MTFDMVTLEFPALVTLTLNALLFPIPTLPKFSEGTLAESKADDAIPIPLKETVLGVVEMLSAISTLLANAPAAFGEKTTSNVDRFPASITSGNATPVIVIPAAEALAFVIVRFVVPSLEIVTDWDAVLPRGTEPKLMEAGATEIVAPVDGSGTSGEELLEAPVTPVHPEVDRIKRNRNNDAVAEINRLLVTPKSVALFFAPCREINI